MDLRGRDAPTRALSIVMKPLVRLPFRRAGRDDRVIVRLDLVLHWHLQPVQAPPFGRRYATQPFPEPRIREPWPKVGRCRNRKLLVPLFRMCRAFLGFLKRELGGRRSR